MGHDILWNYFLRMGRLLGVGAQQLGIALALAVAAGCGSDGTAASPPEPIPEGGTDCNRLDFSAFDSAVTDFVEKNGLKGASGVIVHKGCGAVHLQGYGAYSADRVYLVGSSSKIVSVGVLMRLADQGRLDIEAPIGQYLSAWTGNGKPELTIAQLLSNSSGLVSLTDNPVYAPYLCQYRSSGTLGDCAKAIYTANDADKRRAPDTSFHYGGAQWQLAGGIAEEVSAKAWSDLVRETYVDTCDMKSLGFTNQFTGSALNYPTSFQGDPANLAATENPSIEGGMFINVADYGKLLLIHLRDGQCPGGQALSARAVQRMRQDRIAEVYGGSTAGQTGRTTGAHAFLGYGLGWWIDRTHPGVFADPGLYGAFPWLDLNRNYGAFLAIEGDSGETGGALYAAVKPVLDAAFDAAFERQ